MGTTDPGDTLLLSRTLRAPMPDREVQCGWCDDSFTERGLYGHASHVHGVDADAVRAYLDGDAPAEAGSSGGAEGEAEADASEARAEAGAEAGGSAHDPAPHRAGPADSARDLLDGADRDGDPLDEALAEWVHRRKQREAIRTLSEMDDRPDGHGPDANRDGGRSHVADLKAVAEVVETVDSLTGPSVGPDDVRAAVRDELAGRDRAAPDGGPVAGPWAALSGGADPDAVATLMEAESGGGLADAVSRTADALADLDGETVAGAARLLGEARAVLRESRPDPDPREPPEYREYREARERADSAGPAGATGHNPSRPPEMPQPDHGRRGDAATDASGRSVRRAEPRSAERLERVRGGRDDPDPDAGAVVDEPHQRDNGDGGGDDGS